MSDLALANQAEIGEITRVLVQGDLKNLSEQQRVDYYEKLCQSLRLNPLTRPFEFMTLQGKLILYAKKDCTEQLRKNQSISLQITTQEFCGDVYRVAVRATDPSGRCDESSGVVSVGQGGTRLTGDALANAMMKAETKAKRRATLSICGLGLLDESEIETIPEQHRQMQSKPPAITNKNADGELMVTEKTLGEIRQILPNWLEAVGVTSEQKEEQKEKLTTELGRYQVNKFSELREEDAQFLLTEMNARIKHFRETKQIFGGG